MTDPRPQGRDAIEALLAARRLERVAVDRDLAALHLEHARRHIDAASILMPVDVAGSFQLAYDAARKSLAAVLAAQGLRATARGGHRVIEEAARAQLDPPLGVLVDAFGWMRNLRNASEYLTFDRPAAAETDAQQAIRFASELMAEATLMVRSVSPF